MKKHLILSALYALLLTSVSVKAEVIDIVNASFENGTESFISDPVKGDFSTTSFEGWIVTGSAGRYNSENGRLTPEAFDGVFSAYSNGGSLTQNLGVNLKANTTYTLSFALGDRTDTILPGFFVNFLDNGSILAGGSLSGGAPVDGGWTELAYSFTSLSNGGELGIRLASSGVQTNFDKLSLQAVSSVPEPQSYAMMLLGLGFIGFAALKRKA